jgi:membrane associated rhomboid family serine protease
MNITPVVKQLLIINILFFIGSYFVPVSYDLFSLYYPESDSFKGWQLITHMFMHAPFPNVAHILFNMFALYSFGSALEHFWGGKKFLFFYISCGLGAALLHSGVNFYTYHVGLNHLTDLGLEDQLQNFLKTGGMSFSVRPPNLDEEVLQNMFLVYNTPMLGASGAIYGLLAAFAFMFPNAELALLFIPVPIKAKYFVPGILAIDLFLGFKGQSIFGAGSTGIAHFAHVGGAITGFLMMWFWKKNQFNKNRWN